ncbi:beta-N-acetylhexosaminidase [Pseudoalteromonas piratica]|uniref:N-acetyl-beta-glucosaminidase n=1 Tax=Pseudoalteromonas piratica TaxID=1348114 RepID=A0A0A7EM00_9GAMM|nr:beta-N-acetylhexosaminidase [Pseudoalteromonas piratica]
MSKLFYLLKVSFLLVFSGSLFASSQLMPMPKTIDMGEGQLKLTSPISISVDGMSAERKAFQLQRLQQHFSRIVGKEVVLKEVDKNATVRIVVAEKERTTQTPLLNVDESYQLKVDNRSVTITAKTVFGAQHGLTTLVQLAANGKAQTLNVPSVIISDNPRFAWRGLLIDSARHFISIETIKRQLSTMASAKLNVLHWHLTDDQGWRIESKRFPKLTEKASDGLYYTQAEVLDVIHYASLLGIRVVPEFGMPGHASAIAVAYPELMAEVKNYEMERHWGVFKPLLNISKPEVYQFVDSLIEEMTTIFPDPYLHIGGDEVEPEQWLHNKDIQGLMAKHSLKNGADLQNYFNTQIQPIIEKHQRIMMGWDEIFHENLPKDIVVQSWRGHDSLNAVANSGYQGILSTGFYIDQPQYSDYHYRNDPLRTLPSVDLSKPQTLAKSFIIDRLKGSDVRGELLVLGEQVLIKLNNNHHQLASVSHTPDKTTRRFNARMDSWMGPLTFEFDLEGEQSAVMIGNSRYPLKLNTLDAPSAVSLSQSLNDASKQRILGAEATIWSEMVTDHNIDLRIWPRLYAISERLWSPKQKNDANDMYQRLGFINTYAAEVIGAAHLAQQKAGFNALLPKSFDNDKKARTIALLNVMAELLEPAHYYTRHHIKYLNDEYHQQAALDNFVDYLAVESHAIRQLNNWVDGFINGDKTALDKIKSQLNLWSEALSASDNLLNSGDKLALVRAKSIALTQFIALSLNVIAHCQGQTNTPMLGNDLLFLQPLTDELVIAGIYPMRELYLACTN